MYVIFEIVAFLLGMCICVQLIAALYGPADQWYTISSTYPAVIRRILAWILITIWIAWLLGEGLRPAFFWGLGAYVAFYIGVFWGYQVLFRRNTRLLGIKQPFLKASKNSRVQGSK